MSFSFASRSEKKKFTFYCFFLFITFLAFFSVVVYVWKEVNEGLLCGISAGLRIPSEAWISKNAQNTK